MFRGKQTWPGISLKHFKYFSIHGWKSFAASQHSEYLVGSVKGWETRSYLLGRPSGPVLPSQTYGWKSFAASQHSEYWVGFFKGWIEGVETPAQFGMNFLFFF